MSKLPLERTDAPGIYRRGSKYVVGYRVEGRQRKQYAHTLAEARAIKLKRDGGWSTRALCPSRAPRTSRGCGACAPGHLAMWSFEGSLAMCDRAAATLARSAFNPLAMSPVVHSGWSFR